jgi:hypothetical protein
MRRGLSRHNNRSSGGIAFSPLSLFASGAQGVWFDDSNMATMFQDSAGTIPVTTVEQFVGKQLDLSGNNNHRIQATGVNRPTLSARYNLLTATATLSTQSITTVATSYTITFTGAGTVTLSGTYVGVFSAGTNTFTATAGTLTVTVVGSVLTADIRPTNQTATLPSYQSVTSSTVYDTVGFPQYLKYSGTNSSLSTSAINFTATAQMSAFIGMRKIGEAASCVLELSVNSNLNNGVFVLFAPVSTSKYEFNSKGTTFANAITTGPYNSPITNVVTGLGNITAPSVTLRLNGSVIQTTTTTQGTGNYGNYPLYFGARAGTGVFFNGLEFQTVIVGRTLTATEITNTETYVNSKTKAYA